MQTAIEKDSDESPVAHQSGKIRGHALMACAKTHVGMRLIRAMLSCFPATSDLLPERFAQLLADSI